MTNGYFKSPYGIIEIGVNDIYVETVFFIEDDVNKYSRSGPIIFIHGNTCSPGTCISLILINWCES